MTIDELIERLEDYRDEIGGNAEVRLMMQQNWPFENTICGLASGRLELPPDSSSFSQLSYHTLLLRFDLS